MISIHAPREGGDYTTSREKTSDTLISIHAPREGGDRAVETNYDPILISIHAPREGGDIYICAL